MKSLLLIIGLSLFSSVASAFEVGFEKDSSLPIVYLNVALKTGSVTDAKGSSGITNFMGEMLLRGSKLRSKEQIDQELDQMGARIEVETRAEALIIRGAVLSSQLERFLNLLREILGQPTFPENEIQKLKSQITSGILDELGKDTSLGSRNYTRFLFSNHPYGNPTLGRISDIEGLTRIKLQAHYDKLFRDKLLLIVGSGDAEPNRIKQFGSDLVKGHSERGAGPESVQAPLAPSSNRMLIIDKPDRTQTQIFIGQIGVKMSDPDFFPLHVANYSFGGGSFSARLMTEIRVKRGWSYGASSNFRFGTQPRSWTTYLFPASKDTVAALTETLKLIREFGKSGVTQTEFDFAKKSLMNSAGFMFNTPKKRVENLLLERTLGLPDGYMKSYGPEITKVTLDQANHAVAKFIQPNRLTIAVLCTAKDLKDELIKAAGITDQKSVTVEPYNQD